MKEELVTLLSEYHIERFKTLLDNNGDSHKMAGILPFSAKRGKLSVGYRNTQGKSDGLIIKSNEVLIGHEFHYF